MPESEFRVAEPDVPGCQNEWLSGPEQKVKPPNTRHLTKWFLDGFEAMLILQS